MCFFFHLSIWKCSGWKNENNNHQATTISTMVLLIIFSYFQREFNFIFFFLTSKKWSCKFTWLFHSRCFIFDGTITKNYGCKNFQAHFLIDSRIIYELQKKNYAFDISFILLWCVFFFFIILKSIKIAINISIL